MKVRLSSCSAPSGSSTISTASTMRSRWNPPSSASLLHGHQRLNFRVLLGRDNPFSGEFVFGVIRLPGKDRVGRTVIYPRQPFELLSGRSVQVDRVGIGLQPFTNALRSSLGLRASLFSSLLQFLGRFFGLFLHFGGSFCGLFTGFGGILIGAAGNEKKSSHQDHRQEFGLCAVHTCLECLWTRASWPGRRQAEMDFLSKPSFG